MSLSTLTYSDLAALSYSSLSSLSYTGSPEPGPDPPTPTPTGTAITPYIFYLEKSASYSVNVYTGSSTEPTATNIIGQVGTITSKSGGWYNITITPADGVAVFNLTSGEATIPVQVLVQSEVPDAMLYKALDNSRCTNEYSLASLIMAAFKSNIDESNGLMKIGKPDNSEWITRYLEIDEDLKPVKKIW